MSRRGYTLLEVVIALAIGMIVIGGAMFVMTNQTELSRSQNEVVEAQQNVRNAMGHVVRHVQMAGFGVPGRFTIGASVDNVSAADIYGTCAGTDVLTFRYREPSGFWTLNSAGPNTISVYPGVNPATLTGLGYKDTAWPALSQLLIFPGFGRAFLVRTTTKRDANAAYSTQSVSLQTAPELATSSNVVPGSDVHLVRTMSYRVICGTDASGNETRALIATYDYDEDNNGAIDKNDSVPIAPDIEDMQVAFFLDADNDNAPDAALATTFPTASADIERVKGVRISLVARTARPLSQTTSRFVSAPISNIENRPAWTATPTAAPYPLLFRYGRRMLREMVVLGNRETSSPSTFNFISNRYL